MYGMYGTSTEQVWNIFEAPLVLQLSFIHLQITVHLQNCSISARYSILQATTEVIKNATSQKKGTKKALEEDLYTYKGTSLSGS